MHADPDYFIKVEPKLSADEFIDVLQRSTLAARRPVHDRARILGMLQEADLVLTARLADGTLVGVARAISDFHYCTYLSDLAVDVAWQGQGIGKRLLWETRQQGGPGTTLILLAAPAAETYYAHLGLQQHGSCWLIPSELRLPNLEPDSPSGNGQVDPPTAGMEPT